LFSKLLGKPKSKTPTPSKDPQNNQVQNAPDKEKPQLRRSEAQKNLLAEPKSPESTRREELIQERDQQAPLIAAQHYNTMIAQANQVTKRFLTEDKAALALREEIKKAAGSLVEANIDSEEGVTDEEKADAKKYAQEHVEKAGIVASSLHTFAGETVLSTIKESTQKGLEFKAKEGFSLTPNLKMPLQKQVAESKKQAIKNSEQTANSLLQPFLEEIKTNLTNKIKLDASFLNGGLKIGDLGKDEAQLRHTVNDNLVEDSVIDTVYTNKLYDPIKQAIVMKLGVGRGAWRRSKETNAFRQKMKDAARDQAKSDIDEQLDTDPLTSSKSNMGKQYYGMLAKVKSHSLAKGSVDKTMENKAVEIANTVLPPDAMKKELRMAAQSAGYDIARVNKGETKKIHAAALNGAKIKAIELLKLKQTVAVNEARKITKGDKAAPASGPDVVKQTALATGVRQQVKDDEIGKQSIKHVIETDTMDKGLTKIGTIINTAAPNPGDSSSFEFELKIPVEETGSAYILFGLGASAEREDNELTVSAELTFGAGFQTWGLDANFRAGFFLESQGKDANSVMKLISYGMYREMRQVSTSAAESLWGSGGKSGMSKLKEAELWAAMVEQTHMQDGNYVDVGLMAKLQGEINAGVAKMGGELGLKSLRHYDKETIEDKAAGKFGDQTDLDKLEDKAKALDIARNKRVFEAGANTEVKFGDTSVGFGLEGAGSFIDGKLRSVEVSASGSIPFAYGEDADKWAEIASKVVTPISGAAKNLIGVIRGKISGDKELKSKALGSTLDAGTDLMFAIPSFDEAGKNLAEMIKGDETVNDTVRGWITGNPITSSTETVNKILLSSSLDLSLNFEKKWDKAGAASEWEIALEAAQTKSFEIDAEIVTVSVEKSKRLGKLGFGTDDNGGLTFKGGLLGLEKD
jgi:hypothetical protein